MHHQHRVLCGFVFLMVVLIISVPADGQAEENASGKGDQPLQDEGNGTQPFTGLSVENSQTLRTSNRCWICLTRGFNHG